MPRSPLLQGPAPQPGAPIQHHLSCPLTCPLLPFPSLTRSSPRSPSGTRASPTGCHESLPAWKGWGVSGLGPLGVPPSAHSPGLTRWWRSSQCGAEARWDSRTLSHRAFTLVPTTPPLGSQSEFFVALGFQTPPSGQRAWRASRQGSPKTPGKGADKHSGVGQQLGREVNGGADRTHSSREAPLCRCEWVPTPRGCFELTEAFRVGFQVGEAELPKRRPGLGPRPGPERERGPLQGCRAPGPCTQLTHLQSPRP